MIQPRTLFGLAAGMMAILVVAIACGGDDTATPGPTSTPVIITETVEVTKEVEVTKVVEATKEVEVTRIVTPTPLSMVTTAPPAPATNRLIVAFEGEREVNDPLAANPSNVAPQTSPVIEALSIEDADLVYQPTLAESWSLGADGLTWTFNLRQGVPFHFDWGDFTAADVQHSFERYVREDTAVGEKESVQSYLDTMVISDDHTLSFQTPGINPTLFASQGITQWFWGAIMSKAYFDAEGQAGVDAMMVGTGPFQYVERNLGTDLLLERVPWQHYRVDPDFDEIQILFVQEPATRLAMLLVDEAHIGNLPGDLRNTAVDSGGMRVVESAGVTSPVYLTLGGNYLPQVAPVDPDVPFVNLKVRQAMNKAVDRDAINDTILGGRGQPLHNLWRHPTITGWNPRWETEFDDKYGYDPAAARALLAEAEAERGAPLDWSKTRHIVTPRPGFPEAQDVSEAVNSMWNEIGAPVPLEDTEFETILGLLFGADGPSLHGVAWLDASQRFEEPLFVSITFTAGGPTHFYEDEFIEGKWAELQQEGDLSERDRLLTDIGDRLYDQFAVVPLFWLTVPIVINPKVVAEYRFSGTNPPRQLENVKIVRN